VAEHPLVPHVDREGAGLEAVADCIFCSIVAGNAKSWRVYEDDACVAFLDIGQATPGHCLVVPRQHVPDLWALTADQAADAMRAVHAVAHVLRDRLQVPGLNVTQSNGRVAWQDVFHYHVHLIPRYGDDGLVPPWRPTRPGEAELDAVLARISG
jgi:histidine triad (HIT) family protein